MTPELPTPEVSDGVFDADALPVPELDERFAAQVLFRARAELAPALADESLGSQLLAGARGAVVPLLLLSAGGCRTVLTVEEAKQAFGSSEHK